MNKFARCHRRRATDDTAIYCESRNRWNGGGGGERKKEKKEEKNKREKHRGEIFCDLKLKAREGCPVLSAKESRSRVAESEDGNKLRRLMFGK